MHMVAGKDTLAGLVVIFTAVVNISVGVVTHKQLLKLKAALADKKHLQQVFKAHDKNSDGKLDRAEFAALVADVLGSKMTSSEITASFIAMEQDGDGFVDEGELLSWFESDDTLNKYVLAFAKRVDGALEEKKPAERK